MLNDTLRQVMRALNRYFMVPAFRLGLGVFVNNPFTSYVMVLKTTGRKSGKTRYAPVNYAIANGSIYCVSGWGETSDWYRNLLAHPDIEVILPSGTVYGRASLVTDPLERKQMLRKVLLGSGFAGFLEGFNPHRTSEDEIERKASQMQVLRITPSGIGSGAADPGGWAWILWTALSLPLLLWLFRRKR